MRVAWVAHHDIYSPFGGAEMTDREMIARAPEGVEVTVVPPSADLRPYDRVVVSRLEAMHPEDADRIAATEPIFFSHGDVLPRTDATRKVVLASRPFIAQSPLSLKRVVEWAGPDIKAFAMVPYMSLDGIEAGEKEDHALWAHRPVGHKGLAAAREWAERKGVELRAMAAAPRSEVLAAMKRARWFILLSRILDGCPRTVREAQLSGCELVISENVGYWDLEPDVLRKETLKAPGIFWGLVA